MSPDPARPLNPYAPAAEVDEAGERSVLASQVPPQTREDEPLSLRRTALRWLLVCSISAVPSFAFGLVVTQGRIAGMCTGILIFVIAYTFADFRTRLQPWRQNRVIRRTLRFTYGTRIVISVLFPIGAYLDIICGVVTISVTGVTVEQDPVGFPGALITTLVQGCVLNVVLAIYGVLVMSTIVVYRKIRGRPEETPTADALETD